MTDKRSRPPLRAICAAIMILASSYMLSYAPAIWFGGPKVMTYRVYRPVDWLMHETPLREPLFAWAELWEVRADIEFRDAMQKELQEHLPKLIEDLYRDFNESAVPDDGVTD